VSTATLLKELTVQFEYEKKDPVTGKRQIFIS
jgi:hypothetical protein